MGRGEEELRIRGRKRGKSDERRLRRKSTCKPGNAIISALVDYSPLYRSRQLRLQHPIARRPPADSLSMRRKSLVSAELLKGDGVVSYDVSFQMLRRLSSKGAPPHWSLQQTGGRPPVKRKLRL